MIYKLVLTEEAEKQLLQWRKSGQKKDFQKILSLFQELEKHPTTGTGQVEALKGSLSGYWSRRINKHFRIIYTIHEEIVTVEVISASPSPKFNTTFSLYSKTNRYNHTKIIMFCLINFTLSSCRKFCGNC